MENVWLSSTVLAPLRIKVNRETVYAGAAVVAALVLPTYDHTNVLANRCIAAESTEGHRYRSMQSMQAMLLGDELSGKPVSQQTSRGLDKNLTGWALLW